MYVYSCVIQDIIVHTRYNATQLLLDHSALQKGEGLVPTPRQIHVCEVVLS